MLFNYLHHGDLYSDLLKSDLFFRPAVFVENSHKMLLHTYLWANFQLRDVMYERNRCQSWRGWFILFFIESLNRYTVKLFKVDSEGI